MAKRKEIQQAKITSNIVDALSNQIGTNKTDAKKVAGTSTPKLSSAANIKNNNKPNVPMNNTAIIKAVSDISSTNKKILDTINKQLSKTYGNNKGSKDNDFKLEDIELFKENLTDILDIFTDLNDISKPLIENFDAFTLKLDGFGDSLSKITGSLDKAFKNIEKSTKRNDSVFERLKDSIGKSMDGINKNIHKGFTSITGAFTSLISSIGSGIKKGISGIASIIMAPFKAVFSAIKGIGSMILHPFKTLKDGLKGLGSILISPFVSLKNTIKNTFKSIAKMIISPFQSIWKGAKSLFGFATSPVKSIKSLFRGNENRVLKETDVGIAVFWLWKQIKRDLVGKGSSGIGSKKGIFDIIKDAVLGPGAVGGLAGLVVGVLTSVLPTALPLILAGASGAALAIFVRNFVNEHFREYKIREAEMLKFEEDANKKAIEANRNVWNPNNSVQNVKKRAESVQQNAETLANMPAEVYTVGERAREKWNKQFGSSWWNPIGPTSERQNIANAAAEKGIQMLNGFSSLAREMEVSSAALLSTEEITKEQYEDVQRHLSGMSIWYSDQVGRGLFQTPKEHNMDYEAYKAMEKKYLEERSVLRKLRTGGKNRNAISQEEFEKRDKLLIENFEKATLNFLNPVNTTYTANEMAKIAIRNTSLSDKTQQEILDATFPEEAEARKKEEEKKRYDDMLRYQMQTHAFKSYLYNDDYTPFDIKIEGLTPEMIKIFEDARKLMNQEKIDVGYNKQRMNDFRQKGGISEVVEYEYPPEEQKLSSSVYVFDKSSPDVTTIDGFTAGPMALNNINQYEDGYNKALEAAEKKRQEKDIESGYFESQKNKALEESLKAAEKSELKKLDEYNVSGSVAFANEVAEKIKQEKLNESNILLNAIEEKEPNIPIEEKKLTVPIEEDNIGEFYTANAPSYMSLDKLIEALSDPNTVTNRFEERLRDSLYEKMYPGYGIGRVKDDPYHFSENEIQLFNELTEQIRDIDKKSGGNTSYIDILDKMISEGTLKVLPKDYDNILDSKINNTVLEMLNDPVFRTYRSEYYMDDDAPTSDLTKNLDEETTRKFNSMISLLEQNTGFSEEALDEYAKLGESGLLTISAGDAQRFFKEGLFGDSIHTQDKIMREWAEWFVQEFSKKLFSLIDESSAGSEEIYNITNQTLPFGQSSPTNSFINGAGNVVELGESVADNFTNVLYNSVSNELGRKYGHGDRNRLRSQGGTGGIDCSGLVAGVWTETIDGVNKLAGKDVFGKDVRNIFKSGNNANVAADIMKKANDMGGLRKISSFADLREGDVLGLDADPNNNDRFMDIDHAATMVKNPETGKLELWESVGGEKGGVKKITDPKEIDRYIQRYNKRKGNGVMAANIFSFANKEYLDQTVTQNNLPQTSSQSAQFNNASNAVNTYKMSKNMKNIYSQYGSHITAMSKKYGIPENLIYGLIQTESSGQTDITSEAGAYGLTQLMEGTAKGLGVDRKDPYQNIEGGVKYLSQLRKQFGGNMEYALSAYNMGPNGFNKYLAGKKEMKPETANYAGKVFSYASQYGTLVPSNMSPPDLDQAAITAEKERIENEIKLQQQIAKEQSASIGNTVNEGIKTLAADNTNNLDRGYASTGGLTAENIDMIPQAMLQYFGIFIGNNDSTFKMI